NARFSYNRAQRDAIQGDFCISDWMPVLYKSAIQVANFIFFLKGPRGRKKKPLCNRPRGKKSYA
ncbi:MAG: hypothetical protein K2L21_09935, partial [Muribaculaceae bacterium]|nr:hypothetical protein [Muribaculaceae bacterium]